MNARDIMAALAAHFPPAAISWRMGPKHGTRTKPLAYLDARDVASRLDEVMGADWQCEYVPMPNGTCCCRIGLLIDGQWRWRSNGAGETDVEGEKGQYSAALKRAAVMWGVGAYLYNCDAPWVETKDGKAIADSEYPKLEALLRKLATPKPQEPQAPSRPSPLGNECRSESIEGQTHGERPDGRRGDASRPSGGGATPTPSRGGNTPAPASDAAAITKAVTDVFPDAQPVSPVRSVAESIAPIAQPSAVVRDARGKKTSGEIRAAAAGKSVGDWKNDERSKRSRAAMGKLLSGPISAPGVIPLGTIEADLPEVGGTKSRHRLSSWERLLRQNEGLLVEADRTELQRRRDNLSKAIDASFHNADPQTGEVASDAA